jgi:hypothetical protein
MLKKNNAVLSPTYNNVAIGFDTHALFPYVISIDQSEWQKEREILSHINSKKLGVASVVMSCFQKRSKIFCNMLPSFLLRTLSKQFILPSAKSKISTGNERIIKNPKKLIGY